MIGVWLATLVACAPVPGGQYCRAAVLTGFQSQPHCAVMLPMLGRVLIEDMAAAGITGAELRGARCHREGAPV